MKLIETSLPGVVIIEPRVFGDDRGCFMESWKRTSLGPARRDFRARQPQPTVQRRAARAALSDHQIAGKARQGGGGSSLRRCGRPSKIFPDIRKKWTGVPHVVDTSRFRAWIPIP
jgi:hypothetical protein